MNDLRHRVLDHVASCRDEMLDFTKELVSIPTENPPGRSYRDCIEALGAKLGTMGLAYGVHEVPERTGSEHPRYWLQSFYGEGTTTLYFHGHYDVVPASDREQFRPHLDKDNLFGRGTSDMKGGLVAMIYAIKALKELGVALDGRIGLTIVPDEETGGRLGSHHLAEQGLLGRDGIGMLTAEPTSGVIWITLRVRVKGRPSHVGLHYRGINAFERMLVVAQALQRLKREVESRQTSYRIEPEAARGSILMMGGQCEGGDNFNLVPGECWFTVDRRINPEEDVAKEKKALFDILERLREDGIDLEIEVLQEATSAGVREDDLLARGLATAVAEVTGKSPPIEMCPGLLEIRFYAEKGIPALAYGPGLLSVSHGPNEFVKMGDIASCAAAYALTAARLLSLPAPEHEV
jgi:acetylornithine deacetylase/succinyl-diaminopimelate desuccinylase family protein